MSHNSLVKLYGKSVPIDDGRKLTLDDYKEMIENGDDDPFIADMVADPASFGLA